MSEKNKRAEELLFGKERMTFTEIMQSMEACAKINCEKCALHAIIDGWSQADLPDCSTVLMKNASDTLLEYYNSRESRSRESRSRESRSAHLGTVRTGKAYCCKTR